MFNGRRQTLAYASRALTSAERNYAEIEKELHYIVFATQRFHRYTFEWPVNEH